MLIAAMTIVFSLFFKASALSSAYTLGFSFIAALGLMHFQVSHSWYAAALNDECISRCHSARTSINDGGDSSLSNGAFTYIACYGDECERTFNWSAAGKPSVAFTACFADAGR